MEVKAIAKYVRVSPTKIRRITDLIQGKQTEEAMKILDFVHSSNAEKVKKVLRSVVSNAQNNFELNPNILYVKRAFVDKGPASRRIKPRARGRADFIKKRTSHITIILEGKRG